MNDALRIVLRRVRSYKASYWKARREGDHRGERASGLAMQVLMMVAREIRGPKS